MGDKVGLPASLVAVGWLLNYGWEVGQMLLMVVPAPAAQPLWRACLPATLFDGGVILLLYLGGIWAFADPHWILRARPAGVVYLVLTGLAVGIAIEFYGVHWTGRWRYTPAMPLVPGLEVGLLPVLQMGLLPLASAVLVRAALPRGLPRR